MRGRHFERGAAPLTRRPAAGGELPALGGEVKSAVGVAALAAMATACPAGCNRQGVPASQHGGGAQDTRSSDAASARTAEKSPSPGVLVGVKAPFEHLDRASAKTLGAAQAGYGSGIG